MHENKNYIVSHPRDPKFLSLRSLQNPSGRHRTGLYIIEGIRHVARAVEHCAAIQSVFFDPSVLSSSFGRKLLQKLRKSGVSMIQLSHQLYKDLTIAAEPQGIGAVLRQQWVAIENLRPASDSFWLVLESIDSPGNLGTIIRTAEATGISGIFIIGAYPDPWDPAAVRATMGSLFSQRLARCSAREFGEWAKAHDVTVVGSSPEGLLEYTGLRYRWPLALVVGSEKHGLSEQLIEVSDFMVRIPMVGRVDSINATVAAGVLLYEMFNQRRRIAG